MKIKEIKIRNFRCYENVKIKLNPEYTVLIGINGAGKTTILYRLQVGEVVTTIPSKYWYDKLIVGFFFFHLT